MTADELARLRSDYGITRGEPPAYAYQADVHRLVAHIESIERELAEAKEDTRKGLFALSSLLTLSEARCRELDLLIRTADWTGKKPGEVTDADLQEVRELDCDNDALKARAAIATEGDEK